MYFFLPRLIRKPVNPPPDNRELTVFVCGLTTLSVDQTTWRGMAARLKNNEEDRIWKESVVT
jgi:hypothetical protein